jgi:hypothetical protein
MAGHSMLHVKPASSAIAYRCGITCDGIEVVEPVPIAEGADGE